MDWCADHCSTDPLNIRCITLLKSSWLVIIIFSSQSWKEICKNLLHDIPISIGCTSFHNSRQFWYQLHHCISKLHLCFYRLKERDQFVQSVGATIDNPLWQRDQLCVQCSTGTNNCFAWQMNKWHAILRQWKIDKYHNVHSRYCDVTYESACWQ